MDSHNASVGFFKKHHVTLKLIAIAFLVLILLIPMTMIRESIREREGRRMDAEKNITGIWGGNQTVGGPVLTIPYKILRHKGKENEFKELHYAHFLPDELNIDAKVTSQIRYRGIFEIPVYLTDVTFKGWFEQPDFNDFGLVNPEFDWESAFVSMGIPDLRGIKETIPLEWDSSGKYFKSGVNKAFFLNSGVNTPVPVQDADNSKKYQFTISLKLAGSKSLNFIPLGRATSLKMSSEWPSPSFTGAYLPDERNVTRKGFTANWNTMDLGRNYPQKAVDSDLNLSDLYASAMGVDFIIPSDHYKLSTRSAKYAILFISLTFLLFFIFEMFNGLRIHPLQYLLVGFANCLFYLLLISISEHADFYMAYAAGSITVILMISAYCWTILKNKWKTLSITVLQAALYGYLFVLLQSEDYSFLFGSFGLFVILALFMYFTRKVNWYTIGISVKEKADRNIEQATAPQS